MTYKIPMPKKENLTLLSASSFQEKSGEVWKVSIDVKDVKTNRVWNCRYQMNGLNRLNHCISNCLYSTEHSKDIEDYTREKETEVLDYIREQNPRCFSKEKPTIECVDVEENIIKNLIISNAMNQMILPITFLKPTQVKGMRKPKMQAMLKVFISTMGDVCVTASKKTGTLISELPIIKIN